VVGAGKAKLKIACQYLNFPKGGDRKDIYPNLKSDDDHRPGFSIQTGSPIRSIDYRKKLIFELTAAVRSNPYLPK
jgi:hypothetical protein